MFDFLKKRDLYDQGFEDAETMYSVWKDITSPLDAYQVVQNHILQTEEFETKPLREIEGWKGFLVQLASQWQIPAETSTNLACDLLEFLSMPSLPSSLPSSVCVANKPDIGYIEAEIEYYKLLDKGFDIQAIYDWFHMNKVRLTARKGFDYKAGFFLFINKKIVPAMELKAMYEMEPYKKA